MRSTHQFTAVVISSVLIAACAADRSQDRASTPDSENASATSSVEIVTTQYRCGPTDGDVIAVVLRSKSATSVVADLVVGREAYGQSEPIALSAGVDTRASFDAALTDAAYQLGAGDVRVREVDERGNLGRTLAQCPVPLRFPAGVACG